jgi:NTE family protein
MSETAKENNVELKRPKIGLVLSGGGARGFAHIGVLKVLEKNHIPIDYIAGTSMGAVIAGLYASGLTPAEIEAAVAGLDWDNIFADKGLRQDRSFRRKRDDMLYLVDRKLGVKEGEIKLRSGLVQGQQFDLALHRLTLHARGIRDFDKLRIPYRAVATDITTGEEVVLSSGDLATSIRASMSVPAAFSAVEINGRLLVDGGMANNLPIRVVRDMGADIIIAVDISTPLLKRDELDTVFSITGQLTGFLTQHQTAREIATLTNKDVLIVPDLGEITSGDFSKFRDVVPTGSIAAEKKLDQLQQLSLSDSSYNDYLALHPHKKKSLPQVQFIRVDNPSILDDRMLTERLDVKLGETLDVSTLEKGIGRIYGLDIFQNVGYEVVEEDGQTGLVIHAREKSWGTDGLQFGLEISSDFDGGDHFFNIGTAFTKAPINSLNGEHRTILQYGAEPTLITELYQPLDIQERFYIKPIVGIRRYDIIISDDGNQIAEQQVDILFLTMWGGYNFDTWGRISLGLNRSTGNTELKTGGLTGPIFSPREFDGGGGLVLFQVDTLDSSKFPRRGYSADVNWRASREGLGADTDFDQARLNFLAVKTWGEHTLLGRIRYDTTVDDNAPVQNRFRIGGFMNLSGYQQKELSGQHAGQLTLGYMNHSKEAGRFSSYLGASIELGNAWQRSEDVSFDNSITAGSLFVGWNTPVGPVYLAYGQAEGGPKTIYLFVGQPWRR